MKRNLKLLEVAEKLKLQLKKLELIRLLSDQMFKREEIRKRCFYERNQGAILDRYYSSKYSITLYELLKSYSSIVMTKDFKIMNIPRLPVFTTEERN